MQSQQNRDIKNAIRDRGSTARYSAYNVDTFHTIQTALNCLNSSVHSAYLYILLRKVWTLLEWADALPSKKWSGVDRVTEWMDG